MHFPSISCTSCAENFECVNSLTKFSLTDFDQENFDSVNATLLYYMPLVLKIWIKPLRSHHCFTNTSCFQKADKSFVLVEDKNLNIAKTIIHLLMFSILR